MQRTTRLRADSAGWWVQSGQRVDGAKRLVAVVVIQVIIGACGSTGPDTAPSPTSMPVAPTSTPSISTTTASPPALDQAFLQEQVDKVPMPEEGALMITVIDSPGDAITAATGTDEGENSPTADDPFRVGSITKMFTASLVMILVDDGLVDVDEPAPSYVSRVAVPEDVTVRDLLQHTSGIRSYTDSPDFFARMTDDPSQVWTPESAIALVDL